MKSRLCKTCMNSTTGIESSGSTVSTHQVQRHHPGSFCRAPAGTWMKLILPPGHLESIIQEAMHSKRNCQETHVFGSRTAENALQRMWWPHRTWRAMLWTRGKVKYGASPESRLYFWNSYRLARSSSHTRMRCSCRKICFIVRGCAMDL